jgi:hypothetical protein
MRRIEAIRDRIMRQCGTDEPLILETDFPAGYVQRSMHWRKPLRIDEINRMAQTPEVRERRGRP